MKPKNFKALACGGAALLVFLFLLFLQTRNVFAKFDLPVTRSLQQAIPKSLDVPLSLFSLLGSFEVTALLLVAIAVVFYQKLKVIPYSLVLFFGILFFEFVGKLFVFHPGPTKDLFRYSLPFNLPTSYVRTNYSFPSGHVGRTFFLLVILMFLLPRLVKGKSQRLLISVALTLISLVMMVSRVYLGEHWTSDVIGGAFLGSAMGFLSLVYF